MTRSLEAIRAELSAAMTSAMPGRAAADGLCTAAAELLQVDGVAVSMVYEGASRGTFGSSGEASRRLDEYQFTFGEGPCLDAVATREAVLVPDLNALSEHRWPIFTGAVLEDGIHSVFALPIMVTSVCIGALDLFRAEPGSLHVDQFAGAVLAAQLASLTLLDLMADDIDGLSHADLDAEVIARGDDGWGRLADIDRIEVYQATGVLISQLDVSAAEALVRLRAHAIASGQTASEVAWAILDGRLALDRDDLGGTGRSDR